MSVNNSDVLKIVVHSSLPEVPEIINILHSKLTGAAQPVSDPIVRDGMLAWIGAMIDAIVPAQAPEYHWDSYDLYDLTQERMIASGTIGEVGTGSADAEASGVAAVIGSRSSVRKRRGRTFIAGGTDQALLHQKWIDTMLVYLATWALAWLLGYSLPSGAGKLIPVVMRALGPQIVTSNVVATTVKGVPGYQRRREPGVGA